MTISFEILDSEADIIAEQYAFDGGKGGISKDEFVLNLFKEFGRTAISSKKEGEISITKDEEKKVEVEAAKDAISF